MPKTVDPVFSSSVLAAADLATALDIDALTQSLAGLEGKVDKNPKTAAIILAGGTGERFGKEGGKQLVEIGGKPILTWSVEAFDAVGDIGLIDTRLPGRTSGRVPEQGRRPLLVRYAHRGRRGGLHASGISVFRP